MNLKFKIYSVQKNTKLLLVLKKVYLFLAIVLSGLIVFVSLKEEIDFGPDIFNLTDKIVHFGAYLVLTFLWSRYFVLSKSSFSTNRVLLFVALGLLFYGIIIEVLQSTITKNRSGEFADIMANVLGIVVASFIVKFISKHKLNTNKGLFF